MYVDFDARISELGRQPFTARKFFLKYQDRIMFGTDTTPRRDAYRVYFRFLETEDEYFDCAASHHRQGFWNIYGINLPPEVLDKIYRKNAERILYGLKPNTDKPGPRELKVKPTDDFEVNGLGDAKNWDATKWVPLHRREAKGLPYDTKVKVLYSEKGLYVLMDATDQKLTAKFEKDFENLWTQLRLRDLSLDRPARSPLLRVRYSPSAANCRSWCRTTMATSGPAFFCLGTTQAARFVRTSAIGGEANSARR